MRIQIASDLHLEMLASFPGYRVIEPAPDADVLVLAGDIHKHLRAIDAFRDWPVPVIYVHGNHEVYRAQIADFASSLRHTAEHSNVRVLERDAIELNGVRILGCCLWTDYEIMGDAEASMVAAEGLLPDHTLIEAPNGEAFTPRYARTVHEASRAWLAEQLAIPFSGKTVVVTHHGPHEHSIADRFAGSIVNGSFVSDLTPLVREADLWIHGHVHDSFDYHIGKCRIVANPRGYAGNVKAVATPAELRWENERFNPSLVIDTADLSNTAIAR